ncbi:hypothetical protein [Seleniivibrio sp.]|uniref:hypothetical protein n=1 Tax=Seleniivibrio sp. TaxID=2898801 RepID=UPI0025F00110|nr:hypothetical protein [Seleniivibrio sp.]MCD8553589.1 hypothetical protein [Seleniivibrio sp.]
MYGLVKRMLQIVKGHSDAVVTDLEKSNPEAVYRASIMAEREKILELQNMATELKGRIYMLNQDKETAETGKDKLHKDFDLILKSGGDFNGDGNIDAEDEEYAAKILMYIDKFDTKIKEIDDNIAPIQKEYDNVLAILQEATESLKKLEDEMETGIAALKTADVIAQIQNRRNRISNEGVSLDTAKEAFASAKAKNQAYQEIRESIPEATLENVTKTVAMSSYKEKARQLMAEKNSK